MPTEFGAVTLALESFWEDDHVDGQIELATVPAGASPPAQLVLWLNVPGGSTIDHVTVDGKPFTDFRDARVLLPPTGAHSFRVDF